MELNSLVKKLVISGASAAVILGAFLHLKEDTRLYAYQDAGGIWTICDGLTTYQGKPVRKGMRLTAEQCKTESARRHNEAVAWVKSHISSGVKLSEPQIAGVASFCYWNIGPAKCLNSTFWKELNTGRTKSACEQVKRWIYDGGKDCRIRSNNCFGQVDRREQESALICWGITQT